jgi:protein-tyrosine phosphatase|tara:strand:+ start:262 stop:528 length:267 start_codon:yes stop_codon:yes gene_type:complete
MLLIFRILVSSWLWMKKIKGICLGSLPSPIKRKISLLLDLSSSEPSAVPEPYCSGEKGFDLVLALVEEACAKLLENLSSKIQAQPKKP